MFEFKTLSREGTIDILRRLSIGEAKFNELNKVVTNTRTLTRRLKELQREGLIHKVKLRYRITSKGLGIVFKIAEFEGRKKQKWVQDEEFANIGHRWMKISLRSLVDLFIEEFGDELISIVLYGSAIKRAFQLGKSDIDMLYILEDSATDIWQREENIFKRFQATWEYRACNYMLKTQGFYGYPEVTTTSLHRSYAKTFQLAYLDMLLSRAVLYDKDEFFQKLMKRLRKELKILGTTRVEYADGTYCWLLKPDVRPGELIEINLR